MNISKILRKYTDTLDNLSIISGLPASVRVSFDITYLGMIKEDYFEVVIKDSKSGLGWLYSDVHAVVYKILSNVNYIDLATLREFAQEKLKEKKFIPMGGAPEINKMQKFDDGKIVGYLSLQEVISISSTV
jgi:hypothetical protein